MAGSRIYTVHMKTLLDRLVNKDAVLLTVGGSAVAAEIAYCETRFAEAQAKNAAAIELAPGGYKEDLKDARDGDEQLRRKAMLDNKTLGYFGCEEGCSSRSSSRRSSLERTGQMFKNLRIDYPKFNSDMRQYMTFKRNFAEIVKNSGHYSESQMSLFLRNHCLQGSLKSGYQNLTEFKTFEAKLEDKFLDKVVDMVTRQLKEVKTVKLDDYTSFIDLVMMIEMAHLDLSAVKTPQLCRTL